MSELIHSTCRLARSCAHVFSNNVLAGTLQHTECCMKLWCVLLHQILQLSFSVIAPVNFATGCLKPDFLYNHSTPYVRLEHSGSETRDSVLELYISVDKLLCCLSPENYATQGYILP